MLNIIRLRILKFKDDFKIILLMTVLALAFTFVFSWAQYEGDYKMPIGIINESDSDFAKEVIESIEKSNEFVIYENSYENAIVSLKERSISFALYFDESFSDKNIDYGILRSVETMESIQAENKLKNIINNNLIIDKIVSNIHFGLSPIVDLDFDEMKETYVNDFENWKAYSLDVKTGKDSIWKDFDYKMHMLIGFNIMFSMYTIIFGMADVLNDKKLRVFQRTLVSPIKKRDIVLGNLISTMAIGFVQMLIVLLVGQFVLGIDWGQYFYGVVFIIFTFIFTVSALGLLLSNLVSTMGQLGAVTPIIITATSMIGGCMWPLEIVNSKVLLTASNFTPQKWALVGIKSIAMHNNELSSIVKPTAILLFMGIIFLSLGIYFLDKKELSFNK
ncbi:MAG: ABC transporter permease [Bacillota bacterium]|nr:ABC transporter permease [Bacillota bacterium]